MRALYLVRHGRPALPDGGSLCLGQTDLPLSPRGRAQSEALGRYLRPLSPIQIFTSPLTRCRETAAAIAPAAPALAGLREVDLGRWDGLAFAEIRRRWPELYRRRGADLLRTAPPGGESLLLCGARARRAFAAVWSAAPTRPLVLLAHSGVNRMLCSALLGLPPEEALELPQPYGSITQLLWDGRTFYPGPVGALPDALPPPVPDEADCLALLRDCGTSGPAADHCRAVAGTALELWARLTARGIVLNRDVIFAAALLHDIARAAPDHARAGAHWLTARGYAAVAAVVGEHRDLPAEHAARWTEAGVVYLADKLVQGTGRVTLEQRFFDRIAPEKAPYVQPRSQTARLLWDRLNENRA